MSVHQQSNEGEELSLPHMFGRYLLVERLSRGGMGEIFLARHGLSGFEKLAVIKKVLPNLAEDHEFLSRFIDEAQVAVQLQHANVAQVFEVGRVDDEYFLSIEHIDGRDLRATMVGLAELERPLPVDLALYVAREAANGLAYAHRRTDDSGQPLSVVHCDISPPNIMLSYDGEVKIIDFGIARSALRITETNPNRGFGKFGYLAPEQLLKGQTVDHRTDVYAVGVVLYEMLTGRRMFEVGPNPDYRALARTVVKGLHPLPSSVDPELEPFDALVAKALSPKPEDRYGSAAEFRDEIQRALVKANPTTNADHLADLITELFPDWQDRRRALAEIDKTDLDRWQRQLEDWSGSTVSFARSDTQVEPEHRPEIDTTPTPRELDEHQALAELPPDISEADEHEDGITDESPSPKRGLALQAVAEPAVSAAEVDRDRSVPFAEIAATAKPPLRLGIIVMVLVALLGAASAAIWLKGRGAEPDKAPSPAVAAIDAGALQTPVVTALDGGQVAAASDAAPAAVEPPDAGTSKSRRSRRKRRDQKKADDKKPPEPAAAELKPEDVQRRFRRARRQYQSFKEKYGARLEKQWNELAQLATYAGTADQLKALDQKIRAFDARVRAESK